MGTVKGDLHDIGKNLCIMMLRGAGFVVHDLGVDTSDDEFIEAVEEHEAPILGMSGVADYNNAETWARQSKPLLMKISGKRLKIMVGGAPVTQEFADDMGADGYGKDALECVALAKKFLDEEGRGLGRGVGTIPIRLGFYLRSFQRINQILVGNQKMDKEEYQKRLDKITEMFSSMVNHANEQSMYRCPYKNRFDQCTAKFGCRNQRKTA